MSEIDLPTTLKKLVDEFEENLRCYGINWNSMNKTDFISVKYTYGQAFHETISHLESIVNVFKDLEEEFNYCFNTIEDEPY